MKSICPLIILAAVMPWAWGALTNCGKSTDELLVKSASLSPDPPKVGRDLCVILEGVLQHDITEGAQVRVEGSFWGVNVYNKTSDLCEGLESSPNPCPVVSSSATASNADLPTLTRLVGCFPVSAELPTGIQISFRASATNNGGRRLFCVQGPITFTS